MNSSEGSPSEAIHRDKAKREDGPILQKAVARRFAPAGHRLLAIDLFSS